MLVKHFLAWIARNPKDTFSNPVQFYVKGVFQKVKYQFSKKGDAIQYLPCLNHSISKVFHWSDCKINSEKGPWLLADPNYSFPLVFVNGN